MSTPSSPEQTAGQPSDRRPWPAATLLIAPLVFAASGVILRLILGTGQVTALPLVAVGGVVTLLVGLVVAWQRGASPQGRRIGAVTLALLIQAGLCWLTGLALLLAFLPFQFGDQHDDGPRGANPPSARAETGTEPLAGLWSPCAEDRETLRKLKLTDVSLRIGEQRTSASPDRLSLSLISSGDEPVVICERDFQRDALPLELTPDWTLDVAGDGDAAAPLLVVRQTQRMRLARTLRQLP